jgi:hypothetical protein
MSVVGVGRVKNTLPRKVGEKLGPVRSKTVFLAPAGRSTWENSSWNMKLVRVTM